MKEVILDIGCVYTHVLHEYVLSPKDKMEELKTLVSNIKPAIAAKDWYATGLAIENAQSAAREYAKTLPKDAQEGFVQPFIDMWIHNSAMSKDKMNEEKRAVVSADVTKIEEMLAKNGARRPRRKTRGKSKKRRYTRRR